MIYKQFANLKLSSLGLGTMRFPTIGDDPAAVDMEKTREIVDFAIKNGIRIVTYGGKTHRAKSKSG